MSMKQHLRFGAFFGVVVGAIFGAWLASVQGCGDDGPGQTGEYDMPSRFDGFNVPYSDGGADMAGVDLYTEDGPVFQGDLASDPGGPTITVISPQPLEEVHYNTLKVTAHIVSPAGTLIDTEKVRLLIPSNSASGYDSSPMSLTPTPDTYYGQIDISAIKSTPAPQEFLVEASDVDGKTARVLVQYLHDGGPVITFVQPSKATATGAVNVEIIVDDKLHPLTDGSTVKAGIRTPNDITLTQVVGAVPLRMQGVVTFGSYTPPLDGLQLIQAEATNSVGTVGKATKQFTVDNAGPTIEFTKPAAGQFVGGVLTIAANIVDLSGVDDSTTVAVIGGSSQWTVNLQRTLPAGSEFQGLFDVRALGIAFSFPTLSIRAADVLGNQSEKSIQIIVDNVPPAISIDPPRNRQRIKNSTDSITCSAMRDPVGEEAISDGDAVLQVLTVRARIEDRGNLSPGQLFEFYSGIEPGSVQTFFAPANPAGVGAKTVLVVDTDGDGICDDINPLLVPAPTAFTSNEAVTIQMQTIDNTSGAPDFRKQPDGGFSIDAAGFCSVIGSQSFEVPIPLCTGGMTVISNALSYGYNSDGKAPAIWAIPPITQLAPLCGGMQFDTMNRLPEGLACVAARARDKAGNQNVSAPVRICIDHPSPAGNACASWPPSPASMPDCTGVYDKVTKTIVPNSTCIPALRTGIEDPGYQPDVCATISGFPEPVAQLGGYCYRFVSTARDWYTAEADCQSWGYQASQNRTPGHLVTFPGAPPLSVGIPFLSGPPKEQHPIRQFAGGVDIWLGAGNYNVSRNWVDGQHFGQLNAARDFSFPPQSDLLGNVNNPPDCLYMIGSSGVWNVDMCASTKAYVCKRPFSRHFPARYPAPEVPTLVN